MSSLPQTMKAAVLFDYGDLRISEVEMPTLEIGRAHV